MFNRTNYAHLNLLENLTICISDSSIEKFIITKLQTITTDDQTVITDGSDGLQAKAKLFGRRRADEDCN